ncbi:MAG: hypothetical protein NTW87_11475 [Planctomycetota bacterium]|nr:hypothetical protein [Planctomycetota bacterium]
MTLRTTLLCLLSLACAAMHGAASAEGDARKPLLTVLYSAETHAALLPCDCPLQPLGGVARRATLIKRYRERGPVLLVDAGGWQAGGIYDEDSDGDPRHDELRTQLMARAMVLMGYDAISGREREEALQAKYVADGKQRRMLASGLVFDVQQRAGEPGLRLWLSSALGALSAGPSNAPAIVLSRLGETESTALAAELNEEALIINAGRKTSQRLWWRSGKATLANFDYQAQRLGVMEIYPAKPASESGPRFDICVRLEPLTADIPDDPEIAKLLAPHLPELKKKGKQRLEIEFWTMPECPGCAQAWPDLQRLATDLGNRASIALHFVLHNEDGKLASLHGERELQEAGIQALIQKYYPEKTWAWLAWRSQHPEAPWQEGAAALGLLLARLRGALAQGEAAKLLEADYDLMQRRGVSGSPSLVIANRLYDGSLERLQVLRVVCGLLEEPKPGACKDVPACFFDAQCRKRGFIGRCVDAGKPTARCDTSRPAVQVPAIVVTDRENIYDNHERILEALIGDLPGLEYRVLDLTAPEARDLVQKAGIPRLPAYLLDPAARTEVGYAENVGKVARLDKTATMLVLEGPGTVGSHRVVNRPRMKGRADLFVSRLSKSGEEALEEALAHQQAAGPLAVELVLHDVLYWRRPAAGQPERRELAATNGIAEIEEAARAMAVRKLAPGKFNAYLLERGKQRGSSYWDAPLKAVGIDPAKVRELAEKPSDEVLQALYAEADLLQSLNAGGEIVLLAENCELIPIRSRRDLRDVLERIGPRK